MTAPAPSPSLSDPSTGDCTAWNALSLPEAASTALCQGSARSTGWQIFIHKRDTLSMSDHLSGHWALSDPAIDLTDLYAFPSPSRRGYFVLVLNVFPMARPGALFSDEASYRFRLRPVTTTPSRFEVTTPEYAFTCT